MDDKYNVDKNVVLLAGTVIITKKYVQTTLENQLKRKATANEVEEFMEYLVGDGTDWVNDNAKAFISERNL